MKFGNQEVLGVFGKDGLYAMFLSDQVQEAREFRKQLAGDWLRNRPFKIRVCLLVF